MPKYLSAEELKDAGYLQEVNRRFFHPLGLALEVARDIDDDTGEKGPWRISGIWDYRDDLEGIIYAEGVLASPDAVAKAIRVQEELNEKAAHREQTLGFAIQPIPAAKQ